MRLAVVADIHGNLPALEAIVADIGRRHVDAVVNLGDCVSGPLWPRETLDRLRALAWPTVRGNHDRWVATLAAAELSRTGRLSAEAVGDEGRHWLAELPPRLDIAPGIVAFHASPNDDNAYLAESVIDGRLLAAPIETVARRLGAIEARLVLTSHSHLATVLRLPDGRWLINPGSVGCPAYLDTTEPAHVSESGSPLARYAVLTLDGEGAPVEVDLRAITYDVESAARQAEALGDPAWAAWLRTSVATPAA